MNINNLSSFNSASKSRVAFGNKYAKQSEQIKKSLQRLSESKARNDAPSFITKENQDQYLHQFLKEATPAPKFSLPKGVSYKQWLANKLQIIDEIQAQAKKSGSKKV